MKSIRRFLLVLFCYILLLLGLSYFGVSFADKTVSWLQVALLLCMVLLIIGFAWAYHPVLLGIESTTKRYAVHATLTVLSFILAAFLGYIFFVNMWLLFGGKI
jgi:hypothetical protein